ncbi:MAG: alkaline phosphatase PafA [Candidatus Cyclobacteriaceae bacterium M2_1C_046]
MKKILPVLLLFISILSYSQERPKLVVGVVVDQMKEDYLYRFYKNYSPEGFKKLMDEGTEIKNMHYNYTPTFTAPGHASIYTGSTPAYHGIIGNSWFDRETNEWVYCVSDNSYKTVGSVSDEGEMSPHRMLTTTITDELRLSTNNKAKVVSISIKDRGAILPGGHTGDAYWFDNVSGGFITSTFYHDKLPKWVEEFNGKGLTDKYLQQKWDLLLPEDAYYEDQSEYVAYENIFKGKESPDFPYDLKKISPNYNKELVTKTPFGNDITTEFAKAALAGEELGKDEITDFLAISYSSTDKIGHDFGPQSLELEDTYYRLDRNIADLIKFLNEEIGEGQYLLFLTADHAVADIPQYLVNQKIPAGKISEGKLKASLNSFLNQKFGANDLVVSVSNYQVFLDHQLVSEMNVTLSKFQEEIVQYLIDEEKNISHAWTAGDIHASGFGEEGLKGSLVRGYNQKRSGDVLFAPFPGWFSSGYEKGTTHGSPFTYDTHVPMLWYGWKIPKKQTVRPYVITDIASTLSQLLNIRLPNGNIGQPIMEIFED